jgi:hypothetical protein
MGKRASSVLLYCTVSTPPCGHMYPLDTYDRIFVVSTSSVPRNCVNIVPQLRATFCAGPSSSNTYATASFPSFAAACIVVLSMFLLVSTPSEPSSTSRSHPTRGSHAESSGVQNPSLVHLYWRIIRALLKQRLV